jgi:L-alanine-DL-glutamate epimerase-like enolase superfamily enzyme
MALRFSLRDIALFERPVRFARPFRFGAVRVEATPQLFVRVEIEAEDGGRFVGAAAELLVPKWFDKRPQLSPDQTVAELRRSLAIARELYLAQDSLTTAFGLHAACTVAQLSACAKEDIPPLAAAFGPAEIDKAVLDAALRAAGIDFFSGMAKNISGIDARLTPDLSDAEIATFVAARKPLARVAVRHTVGLDDRVEGQGGVADADENAGARYFKLKLSGDVEADSSRLRRIGRELARLHHDYMVTLDANEQYAERPALQVLVDRLESDDSLRPISTKLLYIEQPMPRDLTRQSPLGELARQDFIIDEADDSYDAFPAARGLGYRGVSSKSCKGVYKSILNAARASKWSAEGGRFFVTGEDLTCQSGLALQQDLALGAWLGLQHAERNGHHYVDGFGQAPEREAEAFAAAHPDLYRQSPGGVRLAIHEGDLLTTSLGVPGFASSVHPDWSSLAPLQQTTPRLS